jgi:flagellar protein FliS
MQSAAKNYIQTQVSTTTQGDLVIMLYDAALKFLHQAKERILEKNYAQKGILISKALDILAELQGSLNVSKGGELAERLQKLYFFCSSRLLTANLKMDPDKIDEVLGILSGLREAFVEANAMVTTKAVPSSPTQTTRIGVTAVPLGRNHLGAPAAPTGPAAMPPMPGLAAQAAAGRYAAAPRPAVQAATPVAVPRPATQAAAPASPAPRPAPLAAAPAAVARPASPPAGLQDQTPRPDVPVAAPLPATSAQTAEPVGHGVADAEKTAAGEPSIETPLPSISPVRRAMAAYSQGRATG